MKIAYLVLLITISTYWVTNGFKIEHENEENKIKAANVLVVYPIGDKCEFRTTNYFEQILNTTSKCFDIGQTEHWIVNNIYDLKTHGEILCNILYNDNDYKNGNFSIVAFSYGGMLARYVIEYCQFPMPVRNLVTFGSPLNGVSAISHFPRDSWIGQFFDHVVDYLINFQFLERLLRPADYWRDPLAYQNFLDHSRFLAEANNECHYNQTKKDKWTGLSNAMFIKFEDDTEIIPKETEWWGEFDENFNVKERQSTRLFQEDLLGLKAMESTNKVDYVSFPGDHMKFNFTQINDFVIPVLRS